VPAEQNKKILKLLALFPLIQYLLRYGTLKYFVENTRVGQMTDYDKLIVEITTDGRITPEEALKQSSAILRKHLDVFVDYNENYVEFEKAVEEDHSPEAELERLLNTPISEIELSVRSANCINNAGMKTIRDLACRNETKCSNTATSGKIFGRD